LATRGRNARLRRYAFTLTFLPKSPTNRAKRSTTLTSMKRSLDGSRHHINQHQPHSEGVG
jgi:hypothetical protein